jgi:hypothetical protein
MAMAGMGAKTQQTHGAKALDPCCNHAGKMSADCAKACAAMCGVAALNGYRTCAAPIFVRRAAQAPMPVAALLSHRPDGLERPPKSIA